VELNGFTSGFLVMTLKLDPSPTVEIDDVRTGSKTRRRCGDPGHFQPVSSPDLGILAWLLLDRGVRGRWGGSEP
jgi:hypothetical protein